MRSPPLILMIMLMLFCVVALLPMTSVNALTPTTDQMVLTPATQGVVCNAIYDEAMVLTPSAVPVVSVTNAEFAVYTKITYGEAPASFYAMMNLQIVTVEVYDLPAESRANAQIYFCSNPFNQSANPFNRDDNPFNQTC